MRSNLLNVEIPEGDTLNVLRSLVETPRFLVNYSAMSSDSEHPAILCKITDTKTSRTIIRCGETADKRIKDPVSWAINAAFIASAKAILELELSPDEQPAIPDEEILLFGSCKGMTFGEVKDTDLFKRFLGDIWEAKGLRFDNQEKNKQLHRLLECASSVLQIS